jgi:molybdopterin synthase catalytic subunit
MSVKVQEEDFDLGAEISALRKNNPKVGAVASFIGVVRDMNDGDSVADMTLEHYPGMTEKPWKTSRRKPNRAGIFSTRASFIA